MYVKFDRNDNTHICINIFFHCDMTICPSACISILNAMRTGQSTRISVSIAIWQYARLHVYLLWLRYEYSVWANIRAVWLQWQYAHLHVYVLCLQWQYAHLHMYVLCLQWQSSHLHECQPWLQWHYSHLHVYLLCNDNNPICMNVNFECNDNMPICTDFYLYAF